MRLEKTMQQHGEEISATMIGTVFGLFVHWLSLIPHIPGWLGQGIVTLAAGSITITATHFLKRELNRRWPDRNNKRGDANG